MAVFESQISDFNKVLNSGNHDRSEIFLGRIKPNSDSQMRMLNHQYARIKIRQNKITEALAILNNTKEILGNNVQLLSSICGCHYLLGDFVQFQLSVEELYKEYNNNIMIKTNVTVKSYNRRFFILFVNFYIVCGLIEECQKQMIKEHTHCVAQYTKFSGWFSIQSFYNFF